MAGATLRSREALRRVSRQCDAAIGKNYELEVIDVYQQPDLARASQVVATPTLVKFHPLPVRRFIGSLSDIGTLFAGMEPAA